MRRLGRPIVPDARPDREPAAGRLGVDRVPADGPSAIGTRRTLVADVVARGGWQLLGPLIRAAIRRTDGGPPDALDRELAGR